MVKLLLETGSERHTSSWQKCQAKFVGGPYDGQYLYQAKAAIVSTEWLKPGQQGVIQNAQVAKTVYDLPSKTRIVIDYKGHAGPENFVIELDEEAPVQEYEIGTSRLRTYTLKGRYRMLRDLVQERADALKASQEKEF